MPTSPRRSLNQVSGAPPRARTRRAPTVCLFFLLLSANCVSAFETDQYLTWERTLRDSSGPINDFVNQRFESVIARLNERSHPPACSAVVDQLFNDLSRTLFLSRIRRFLHEHPEVDRYPGLDVGYWEYRKQSVYRRKAFPLFLPMSRTVRMGDIYLGTDKLGHFFSFGRRYQKRYLRALKDGRTTDDAVEAAIRWGLLVERTAVGGWADGVVSHSDLEANYAGFRLARALCEGATPLLEHSDGRFRLKEAIDMLDWITPRMDESYYSNHYMYYRWRLVRPILRKEVCGRLGSEPVVARFERYDALIEDSVSDILITKIYADWGRRPQDRHSIEVVCSRRTEKAKRQ